VGKADTPNPRRQLRRAQGRRLRQAREAAGLTLAELVHQLRLQDVKISPQAISQWERGETSPRPELRDAVCRMIGADPSVVFTADVEDGQP
jgi:transcriptional regulator with XRE-family HTH domain